MAANFTLIVLFESPAPYDLQDSRQQGYSSTSSKRAFQDIQVYVRNVLKGWWIQYFFCVLSIKHIQNFALIPCSWSWIWTVEFPVTSRLWSNCLRRATWSTAGRKLSRETTKSLKWHTSYKTQWKSAFRNNIKVWQEVQNRRPCRNCNVTKLHLCGHKGVIRLTWDFAA